jgi:hypothetical protein
LDHPPGIIRSKFVHAAMKIDQSRSSAHGSIWPKPKQFTSLTRCRAEDFPRQVFSKAGQRRQFHLN